MQYMARQRIQMDLKRLKRNPPSNCSVGPVGDDIFHWEGFIIGAVGTPYEGGLFSLTIRFPPDYPYQPPKVSFKTKVYHPNINSSGSIDMDMLRDTNWCQGFRVSDVMSSIAAFMADPNLDDPLVAEIGELYRRDRSKYEANAKSWTLKYATG